MNPATLKYQIFHNVLVELENEDQFELDILLVIDEKIVFWFECKSGEYQSYVSKYSNFSKKYNFKKEKSFVILTDVYPTIEQHLTQLHDLNFCSIEEVVNFCGGFSIFMVSLYIT